MQNDHLFFPSPARNMLVRYAEAALRHNWEHQQQNNNGYLFTACPKLISRFLHSGLSLPAITTLPFWAGSDFQGKSHSQALLSVSKGDQSVVSVSVGIHLIVYGAGKSNDKGLSSIQVKTNSEDFPLDIAALFQSILPKQ